MMNNNNNNNKMNREEALSWAKNMLNWQRIYGRDQKEVEEMIKYFEENLK